LVSVNMIYENPLIHMYTNFKYLKSYSITRSKEMATDFHFLGKIQQSRVRV